MSTPILREPPITTRDAAIPYVITGINMLAATLVSRQFLTPQVLLVSVVFILLGVPVSIFLRQRQYSRMLLNLLVMAPLLLLTWAMVRQLPGVQIDWADPLESMMTRDIGDFLIAFINILVVVAAGRALLLVTTRDLLQTPFPSVSIFLLGAVTPSEMHLSWNSPLTLVCLFLLLSSSLYLLSQSHNQHWFTRSIPFATQQQMVKWMVLCSLLAFPFVVVVGVLLTPFNMMRMSNLSAHRSYPNYRFAMFWGRKAGVGLDQYVEVGGPLWGTGNQSIMTVKLARPADLLWRASTFATYTDGRWTNRPGQLSSPVFSSDDKVAGGYPMEQTVFYDAPEQITDDPGLVAAIHENKMSLDPEDGHDSLITQRFEIIAPPIGNAIPLYGATHPYQLNTTPRAFNAMRLEPGGCVTGVINRRQRPSIPAYEMVSIVKPPPSALHLTDEAPLPSDLHEAYLQMPSDHYQYRVQEKALAILEEGHLTASSPPLRVVRQFESYLARHYRYTLKPDPPRNGLDPILDFLTNQQRGYCTFFSGAMVMLCRSVGIPARFVVGFARGDLDENFSEAGAVRYKVTAEHAHAWVEVYLPHYGWYVSDPTAGSTEEKSAISRSWDFLSDMFAIMKSSMRTMVTTLRQDPRFRAYASLAVAGMLVVLAAVLVWRRERPPTLPRRILSSEEARVTVLQAYRKMLRWLMLWGIVKPPHLTAGEFCAQFRTVSPALGDLVDAISSLYLRVQYGGDAITHDDACQAIVLMQQLWAQGRVERKRLQQAALDGLLDDTTV